MSFLLSEPARLVLSDVWVFVPICLVIWLENNLKARRAMEADRPYRDRPSSRKARAF